MEQNRTHRCSVLEILNSFVHVVVLVLVAAVLVVVVVVVVVPFEVEDASNRRRPRIQLAGTAVRVANDC